MLKALEDLYFCLFKGAYFEAGAGGEGTLKIQTQVDGTWTTN